MVELPLRVPIDDSSLEKLIADLTKAGRQAGISEKQLKHMGDQMRKNAKEGIDGLNNLNNKFNNLANDGIKKVGGALATYFALDRLYAFAQGVIRVTSEFQKFAAVLVNTLGSKSQAAIALAQILKFAAQTPFSVQELTNSFVKLANTGFVPVGQEMRKLGDLAASQAKEFIMLTEAIIDAQTGEFERLKEFGIRASKQGDQVIFTFKGVKTQVDFTSEAIRNYIVSLGDAEGVAGSMAAISGTLGGQISNLEDTWDSFLNTLGQGNSGVLKETISLLSQAIEKAKELVTTDEQRLEQLISETQAKAVETFKDYVRGYEDVQTAKEAFFADNEKKIKQLNDEFKAIAAVAEKQTSWTDKIFGNALAYEEENRKRAEKLQQLNNEIIALQEAEVAIEDYIAALEKIEGKTVTPPGLIESLEKQIKALEELKKKAQSVTEISRLSDEIDILSGRLRILKSDSEALLVSGVLDREKLREGLADWIGDPIEEGFAHAERVMKDFTEKFAAEQAKRKALAEQHAQDMREIREAGFNASVDIINAVFDLEAARTADKLGRLREQKAEELALAGDNAVAREKIEKEYERKERQLKREQAQRDRDYALFQIGVNTAAAVVEALPNYVLAAIVGAAGLVQAGIVASKPLPRYAKGKFKIPGPGTETSDSIHAMLSKNESVVDADKSDRWGFFLKPLIEGREDEAMKNMAYHLRGDLFKPPVATDSNSILHEIHDEMKNLKQVNISIDENGFSKWTKKGEQWSSYVNNRYTF